MARSISIDDPTFAHVELVTYSLVLEYAESKSDQKGKRTSSKNCYANPFDFWVYIFTALGYYFCVNDEAWDSEKDAIFRHKKNKQDTAAHIYFEQIKSVQKK